MVVLCEAIDVKIVINIKNVPRTQKNKTPKMKIKFLLIASIFMITSGYSQEKWSLKKCVEYALENNISIKQSALSISLSCSMDYWYSFNDFANGNFWFN